MNASITLAAIAKQVADNMERKTRDNGTEYVALKDHSDDYQWQVDLCRAAHDNGERMPDDATYKVIEEAIDCFAEADEDTDLDELATEIADDVDVYTGELTAWLASHAGNVEYITQVLEEFGGDVNDGFKLLSLAQYHWRSEIVQSVLSSLQERLEAVQVEADEEPAEE